MNIFHTCYFLSPLITCDCPRHFEIAIIKRSTITFTCTVGEFSVSQMLGFVSMR